MALAARQHRTWVGAAGTVALVGIGISVLEEGDALGSWVTVGALLALLAGLHRFGRTGPDEPLQFEAPRRKKKRRKKRPQS